MGLPRSWRHYREKGNSDIHFHWYPYLSTLLGTFTSYKSVSQVRENISTNYSDCE